MKKTFIPLLVGLLCWTSAQAAIRYVSPSGNDGNDGLSVETAKATLTAALNSATSDDEIRVQAGTYQGNFTFKDGVNVSGGWNSTFDAQTDYATVLDANNSGRPVSSTNELSTLTVWSNLTLQNGNPGDGGGGAHLRANARLDHCLIQNNTTGGSGKAAGGVQLYNGGQLYNCIVRNNTATGDCGGVRLHSYNNSEKPAKLVNCLIYGNTATNTIGGVSLESCIHYVYNNTIVNNSQTSSNNASRCGVRLNVSVALLFANNIVWGNKIGEEVQESQMEINSNYLTNRASSFRNNAIVYSADFGTETIRLTADPFEDAANGNYRLIWHSSLVNSGDNTKAQGTTDLAGKTRLVDVVDIGAYECQVSKRNKTVSAGGNLQDSVALTWTGYSVKVQAGTFTGNFTMREGVNVSGGWVDFSDAAPTGETVLDANNSGRPLTQNGEFNTETTWSNFTLTGGNMDGDGGGAYLQTNGALLNCKIQTNTATNAGGVCLHGKGKLVNCLVAGNTATNTNGGVSVESANSDIIGCTIVDNDQLISNSGANSKCGLLCGATSDNGTKLANNIIWGNKHNGAVSTAQIYYISHYSSENRIKNAVYNQDTGTGSITLDADDPGFVDYAGGDYRLKWNSSLVNVGTYQAVQGAHDAAGKKREVDGVDIGAYECQVSKHNKNVKVGDNLQDSIAQTWTGYTIKVQAGTFIGNFTMREGVNVSGGWNSTFDAQTDYATVLDANTSGRVLTQPDVFSTPTVWRNFTIQHGSVAGNGGGALLQANGKLEHCTITHNQATASSETDGDGGGVYCDDVEAGLIMDDCILSYNSAVRGGGARIRGQIQNSTIEHNEASNNAGGLYLLFATATNCHIQNNSAPSAGGVRIFGGTATDCEITSNTATTGNTGGAYVCVGGKLLNSKVMNNSTGSGDVGGVRVNYFEDNETGESSSCRVANCLIANNSATATVGGLYMQQGEHQIYNNTIVDNTQGSSVNADRCGARINTSNALVFANNIVWGNKVGEAVQPDQVNFNGGYDKTNCTNNALVLSSSAGTNTILLTESPFADADYHLIPFSDLINSGDNEHNTGSTDLDGNPRKQGSIDRGCYERTKVSRAVAEGQIWGTICMPFAITSDAIDGATMYKVLSFATNEKKGLLLEQVDNMAAGKPYFFHVNENATTLQLGYVRAGDEAAPGNENGLYGTITAGTVIDGSDYYVLQGTELHPVTGGAIIMPANRAYLKFSEVPEYTPMAPSPRRRVLGIHSAPNSATGFDEVQGDKVQSTKVIRNGQLFIVREGKTYNAQGQLVK